MSITKITFHNKAEIRVQAQIFTGRTLMSTCVAGPGESHNLSAETSPYDIYFKDSTTGWELAHQLGSMAKKLTLSRQKGRYLITGS
jgi:hypothetical protein